MSYPRYVQDTVSKWSKPDFDAVTNHVLAGETVTGYLAYPYSYNLRYTGGKYQAINSVGTLAFGGASDEGGADGDDASEVIQAAIDSLPANGSGIFHTHDKITFDTKIETDTKNVIFTGEGSFGVDVVGNYSELNFSGTGTAIEVGADRTFQMWNLRCVKGDPFLDFLDGVGRGHANYIQACHFTDGDIGIKTGASNPFMQILGNRFNCQELAIDVEAQTDVNISGQNYFVGDMGMTTAAIYIRADSAHGFITYNTFVGTGTTAPEIIMEVGGAGPTQASAITIDHNKFGDELLSGPQTERILIKDLGDAYAVLPRCSFSNNFIANRTDANAVANFINIDGNGDVEVSSCKVNGNIISSGPGTGYLFKGGTNTSCRHNEMTGNVGDAGTPGAWASLPFVELVSGTAFYDRAQGFNIHDNPVWPTSNFGYAQLHDGDTVNHYLPITAAQIAAHQFSVQLTPTYPEFNEGLFLGADTMTATTFTVHIGEDNPYAAVAHPDLITFYWRMDIKP